MSDNALNNEKHYSEKLEQENKKLWAELNELIEGNAETLSIHISELEKLIVKWKGNINDRTTKALCIQDLQKLIDKRSDKDE